MVKCPRTSATLSRVHPTIADLDTIVLNVAAGGDDQHLGRDRIKSNGSARAASTSSLIMDGVDQPWPRIVLVKLCSRAGSLFAERNSFASVAQRAFTSSETRLLSRKPAWPSTSGFVARHWPAVDHLRFVPFGDNFIAMGALKRSFRRIVFWPHNVLPHDFGERAACGARNLEYAASRLRCRPGSPRTCPRRSASTR